MRTDRLVLRQWREEDRAPFAEINADPQVARYIGDPASRADSDALVDRIERHWETYGYGLYAVDDATSGTFLGFIGLHHHRLFPDDVEIGWRLRRDCWGAGLATEGARRVRDEAFAELGLPRLISIAVPENLASVRVMQKIGMTHWRDETSDEWKELVVYELEAPRIC